MVILKHTNWINEEQTSDRVMLITLKNVLALMQLLSPLFALVRKSVTTVTKTLALLVDSNEIAVGKERQEILMYPTPRNVYVMEELSCQ